MQDTVSSGDGIAIAPIAGAIGAEIDGVDLAADLSDAQVSVLRQALLDHCVIFFRDQKLDAEQHKRLARRFGDIFVHPNFDTGDHDPEIVTIVREPGDERIVGEDWHTDTTMMAAPPMGAILYGVDIPAVGGDTLFANQYLAYEMLSAGMKSFLTGLRCAHSDRMVVGPASPFAGKRSTATINDADWTETVSLHPVVRTHPETGHKALFVNHSYSVCFEGMSEDESKPLLNWLMDWGHRPEFTCRFRWTPGAVAFWDNRCVKHLALHDVHDHRRVMRRVQIAGDTSR
jgi:taurine dioxygenase